MSLNSGDLAAIMVGIHLITEYVHYTLEFLWGRKDKNILKDILTYRKSSRKSEMLVEIVKDLKMIKKHFWIMEKEIMTNGKRVYYDCQLCGKRHALMVRWEKDVQEAHRLVSSGFEFEKTVEEQLFETMKASFDFLHPGEHFDEKRISFEEIK